MGPDQPVSKVKTKDLGSEKKGRRKRGLSGESGGLSGESGCSWGKGQLLIWARSCHLEVLGSVRQVQVATKDSNLALI